MKKQGLGTRDQGSGIFLPQTIDPARQHRHSVPHPCAFLLAQGWEAIILLMSRINRQWVPQVFYPTDKDPSGGTPISILRPGNDSAWSRLIGPALILLAAALATSPLIFRGPSCGHDFDFHLVSWFDAQQSWRQGLFYPHWAPSANFGAGEPRFVFYPPLTWMLGAALGLVLPWTLVPIALTFLLLAGTGLATRALAREALDDAPATLAGCVAIFSGYSLFTAYERTAFGELAGGVWIPLLLLFALRDHRPSAPLLRRALDGSTVPLALVLAGAWLSNAPVGVMACYLLAAIAVVTAMLGKSIDPVRKYSEVGAPSFRFFLAKGWDSVALLEGRINTAPLVRAAVATALGISLTAFYLIPAAWEQRWVDIAQATGDPGERIENSWLFGRHADPTLAFHDVVLWTVSLVAAVMLSVAFASLILLWRRGKLTDRRCWWLPLALIPCAVLFLQLPVSLPLWNLLPKLRFLQFPWRWLVALEAPLGIFLAAAIWPVRRWQRSAIVAVCAALFVGISVFTAHSYFQPCDEQDAVPGMVNVYRSGTGFVGTDEYAPPGADNTVVPSGLPDACLASEATAVLGAPGPSEDPDSSANPVWKAAQGSCSATFTAALRRPEHLRLDAVFARPGTLILRLRRYPAWQIKLNGQLIPDQGQREDGLIAIPVPQGAVRVTADWTTTPDVTASRWISALALFLLLVLWFLEQKFARPRLS